MMNDVFLSMLVLFQRSSVRVHGEEQIARNVKSMPRTSVLAYFPPASPHQQA